MNTQEHLDLLQQHYDDVVNFDNKLLAYRNNLLYIITTLLASGFMYFTH